MPVGRNVAPLRRLLLPRGPDLALLWDVQDCWEALGERSMPQAVAKMSQDVVEMAQDVTDDGQVHTKLLFLVLTPLHPL